MYLIAAQYTLLIPLLDGCIPVLQKGCLSVFSQYSAEKSGCVRFLFITVLALYPLRERCTPHAVGHENLSVHFAHSTYVTFTSEQRTGELLAAVSRVLCDLCQLIHGKQTGHVVQQ
jgi:hypothetical protein